MMWFMFSIGCNVSRFKWRGVDKGEYGLEEKMDPRIECCINFVIFVLAFTVRMALSRLVMLQRLFIKLCPLCVLWVHMFLCM